MSKPNDEDDAHQSSNDEDDAHQSGADEDDTHQLGADEAWSGSSRLRSTITGQMCQRVLALIHWRKGYDRNVTSEMMGTVERWLCNRGISIYIDPL
jgi:hypothetical protein